MILLVLIVAITAGCALLAAPLFESVFGVLLCAPLIWFLIAKILSTAGLSVPTGAPAFVLASGAVIVLLGGIWVVFGKRVVKRTIEDFSAVIVFGVMFTITNYYCHTWPDFISMGERLRDYAILASTIKSPVDPVEPWMSGATLNYYVYWYRFGHFLSVTLGFPVWEVYHVMAAFALAFYAAVIFEIVRVALRGGPWLAVVAAVITSMGSNVAGLLLWYHRDANWWGPSRVINGAINEFPAWSFLLGDLHPHFLNLALIPFATLVLYRLVSSHLGIYAKLAQCAIFTFATILWLFAANAWEVPMWCGLVGLISLRFLHIYWPDVCKIGQAIVQSGRTFEVVRAIASTVVVLAALIGVLFKGGSMGLGSKVVLIVVPVLFAYSFFPNSRQLKEYILKACANRRSVVIAAFWVMLLIALRLSSSHIVPQAGDLKFVRDPIPLSRTSEIFQHWGFPLILGALATIMLIPSRLMSFGVAIALGLTLFNDKGVLFLFMLATFQCARIANDGRDRGTTFAEIFGDAIFLAGLGLVLLPEFVFLDDAYGGENERMNTIFKAYTTAWGLIMIGVMSLLRRLWGRFVELLKQFEYSSLIPWSAAIATGLSVIIFLPFFFHTTSLRRSDPNRPIVAPEGEGLSEVNRSFPGSATIIHRLKNSPDGIVLEAQGDAYSYTSFVSTLSGKTSFLGWANHVNLLTGQYGEVSRREKLTESFYQESNCSARLTTARNEKIAYVVSGDLERKKYGGSLGSDYSCFVELTRDGGYVLFAVPGAQG